jgi:hypothetical protein
MKKHKPLNIEGKNKYLQPKLNSLGNVKLLTLNSGSAVSDGMGSGNVP